MQEFDGKNYRFKRGDTGELPPNITLVRNPSLRR